MIPKIIHYCWFGGNEMPLKSEQFIAYWKKLHPDYKFIQWDESNFDLGANSYVKEASTAKKWAFVSDYVRLYALFHMGGIYLDTDVELLRPLDAFRKQNGFIGFESRDSIMTGVIGVHKGSKAIYELMQTYESKHFINSDSSYNMLTNVSVFSKYFIMNGLKQNGRKQQIKGFQIYPQKLFAPNTIGMIFGKRPRDAYTIHHYFGSWNENVYTASLKHAILHYLGGKVRNLLGTPLYGRIRKRNTDKFRMRIRR